MDAIESTKSLESLLLYVSHIQEQNVWIHNRSQEREKFVTFYAFIQRYSVLKY